MHKKQHSCVICQSSFKEQSLFPIGLFQNYFIQFIQKQYPKCTADDFICAKDIKEYRLAYIHERYTNENPIISKLEHDVLKHFKTRKLITMESDNNDQLVA